MGEKIKGDKIGRTLQLYAKLKEMSMKSIKKLIKILCIVVIITAAVVYCVPWLRDNVNGFLKEKWRERRFC